MKTLSLLLPAASILLAGCAEEPNNTFEESINALCVDQITLDDLENPDFCDCVYTNVLASYSVNVGVPPDDISSGEAQSAVQPLVSDAIATCRNG